MNHQSKYTRPVAASRLLLLAILIVGQCCLMTASAFADDHHPSAPMVTQDQDGALFALHMGVHGDDCCVDTPTLVSKAPSLSDPMLNVVVERITAPAVMVQLAVSPLPPPLPTVAQSRLQIYRI